MGKKKKKKNSLNSILKDDSVLVAALGGAAAGIALVELFNSEMGKEIIDKIGETFEDIERRDREEYEGLKEVKGKKSKRDSVEPFSQENI